MTRDRLIAWLWPEADTDRARHLLSQSLYIINRTLDADAVRSRGDDLRLNPDVITSDVVEFVAAADRGNAYSAVALYQGPLLDGFYLADAPEFERWLERERAHYANWYARLLERLARALAEERKWPDSVDAWRRLVAHDRYNSSFALGLVTSLMEAGEIPAAIHAARAHLRDVSEFGPSASSEVAALLRVLQSG